jgi:hypothetical protein
VSVETPAGPDIGRDISTGLEVAIEAPPRSVGVRAYTQLLDQVVLALEEIDRFALPGIARLDWTVDDLSSNGSLRSVITPRRVPPRRPPGTAPVPVTGFVTGVQFLHSVPQIPQFFSPITVQRVEHIGKALAVPGVKIVRITNQASRLDRAIVDSETVDNARRAIAVSQHAFGGVQGRLDVLNARPRGGPRAQVLLEGTRRAVTLRAAPDQIDLLREAWGKRVRAAGVLMRNSSGQPIRLDLTELQIIDEREPTSAWEILGLGPDWTGDLTTDEFIRQARRG